MVTTTASATSIPLRIDPAAALVHGSPTSKTRSRNTASLILPATRPPRRRRVLSSLATPSPVPRHLAVVLPPSLPTGPTWPLLSLCRCLPWPHPTPSPTPTPLRWRTALVPSLFPGYLSGMSPPTLCQRASPPPPRSVTSRRLAITTSAPTAPLLFSPTPAPLTPSSVLHLECTVYAASMFPFASATSPPSSLRTLAIASLYFAVALGDTSRFPSSCALRCASRSSLPTVSVTQVTDTTAITSSRPMLMTLAAMAFTCTTHRQSSQRLAEAVCPTSISVGSTIRPPPFSRRSSPTLTASPCISPVASCPPSTLPKRQPIASP